MKLWRKDECHGPTKGLGRGLGALLGDYNQAPEGDGTLRLLPLQRVEPNPDQPRRDFNEEELQALADSIATHGMLQPLTVREISGSEYYQIIAGERRWRAAGWLASRKSPPWWWRRMTGKPWSWPS